MNPNTLMSRLPDILSSSPSLPSMLKVSDNPGPIGTSTGNATPASSAYPGVSTKSRTLLGFRLLSLLLISRETDPVISRPLGNTPRSGAPRLALIAVYLVGVGAVSLTISLTINMASEILPKLTPSPPPIEAVSISAPMVRKSTSVSVSVVGSVSPSPGSVTAKVPVAFWKVNWPARVTSPNNVASTTPQTMN